ncbi:tektin-2 isoform X1 [Danio rerio]|uniref:Tektin-2 isoform X1 n=1 Tax=Danio rerio TaxID=7955 RepID=A0AC58HY44_DANRE|nr:tektin-2 isoform X1 [Danio rerio]|eukprot:XP_009292318.1 tektin-2 isoform X1 [Danio rerio]
MEHNVSFNSASIRPLNSCADLLSRLQEARQQLTIDLQDKIEALDVDMSCLSLTIQSPEISLKPNPTRVPPGSTNPQQWEQFSRYNISRAREEMQVSVQIRENNSITRAQVQNELEAQRMSVEFALRKRTHHEEQAHHDMQWQLKTTQDEIAELEKDIIGLEEDLQAKTAPLKLVHTRLENRIKRPGMDLCRDEVQFGLVDEAKHLEATILALKQKLAQAQHSLQSLKQHEAQMMEELSRKQDALSLEQRSNQTRQRLTLGGTTEGLPSAVVPLANSSGRHKLVLA